MIFPDVILLSAVGSDSDHENEEEEIETVDDEDEAISRYVDQCIGTVAAELRDEKEQKDDAESETDTGYNHC